MGDTGVDGTGVDDAERLGLFAGLSDEKRASILARATTKRFEVGDVIIADDDAADVGCYVLVSGSARASRAGVELGTIGPGECVGELAVLDDGPRTATVTATTETETLAFSPDAFHSVLEEFPLVRTRLTETLAGRIRTSDSGWVRLAADADLLLGALLELQGSSDPAVRVATARRASELLLRAAGDPTLVPDPGISARTDPLAQLTRAERRVADLVADGLSNPRIAERLYVSRHTVDSHLKRVYAKLHVRSRVQLAAIVLRHRPPG